MTHRALFYDHDAALWEQCAGLLAEEPGARWLYVADEHGTAEVAVALAALGVDVGQGEVVAGADIGFRRDVFRVDWVIMGLRARLAALWQPQQGVVCLVEMSWAVRTPSAGVYFREYETAVSQLCNELSVTIVCLYNQSILLDRQLLVGLHAHEKLWVESYWQKNPHFVPPEIFARRDDRAQFDYWLSVLRGDSALPVSPSGAIRPIYHLESPSPLIAKTSRQGRWKIACFGELRVYRVDGERMNWAVAGGATRKTKTLFAYLLYRGEEGAATAELADLLWLEAGLQEMGLNRLYHTIHSLRQVLEPDLERGRQSPYIVHEYDRYFLAVPPQTWIDVPQFQEHCFRGGQHLENGRFDQAFVCYEAAKRLYRGDLLADLPAKYVENSENDWCWSRRYWFREMYLKLLSGMAGLQRRRGLLAEAQVLCDEGLRLEPCAELIHQEKLRIFAAANRPDALDRQYRLYVKTLAQFEIGEPTPATRDLYLSLRKNQR